MESLHIIPDLERQGLREGQYKVEKYDGRVTIGAMPMGTESGHPTVMIAIDNPDAKTGGFLVIETTLALFLSAADALMARHGDPRR